VYGALVSLHSPSSPTIQSAGLHGRLPDAKRWDGAALKGERLLVWTEQGLGDAVMMMRYLPRLRGCGAGSTVVQCQPPLARCIEAMDVADEVRIAAEPPPPDAYDRHVPIMSLALLAGEAGRVIPNLPYLTVPRDDAERWSARLGARERPRVGLAWAGSKALRDDARRSVPLDAFASLLNLKEIAWFSLQKDEGSDQCAAFGDLIRDWMPFSVDLLDTAALIHNLDLVISVDTVVAHVAGAIGKPVWMLNRFGSEWRWGLAGESTPWYPSMRILRQPRAGDWSTVIGEVHASLQALAGAGR